MKNPSIIVLLSLFAATALAAPIPDSLETVELDARNPWVGTLLRGLGRGAKSLPEKAGKKVEKEKGQANVAEGKRLKEVTNRWNKYTGKENDPKCIQGIMNRFSQYGGYNMVIDCSKNKPKSAWSKTKTGTSYAGEGSSNTKSPWSKTKTGTSYAGRSFSGDGLEEREFSFEFDLDEREQLDFDVA